MHEMNSITYRPAEARIATAIAAAANITRRALEGVGFQLLRLHGVARSLFNDAGREKGYPGHSRRR